MSRDYAREVRYALTDPKRLCDKLGLSKGSQRQARGRLVCCPAHGERRPSCSITTGPDGTIRVRCFSCGWTGDALTLIAQRYGLSLRSADEFREVLATGAELAGHLALADEIRLDGEDSDEARERAKEARSRRQRLAAPVSQPEPEYPPLDEIRALWADCGPANDDPEICAMLVRRRIDPDVVTELDLGRALPAQGILPRWAAYGGRSWRETGHRLILRAWDDRGALRSVRGWRVTDGDSPKRLPPAGHKAAELVQVNRGAWLMLAGRYCPLRLYVVEGEPDMVVAATTFARHDSVIGIGSGSWTEAFARRVPRGTEVIVATHADDAGDRYAAHVLDTLGDRCPTYRWRMAA